MLRLRCRSPRPTPKLRTSAITYRGHLTASGSSANGSYDLIFQLFDAPTGGNQVNVTITNANQAVSKGLFVATLDFGSGAFTGPDRWLQIGVRANGSEEAFVPLTPRQLVMPAPYALYAVNANMAQTAGNVSAANITGQLRLEQSPKQVLTSSAGLTAIPLSGPGASVGNVRPRTAQAMLPRPRRRGALVRPTMWSLRRVAALPSRPAHQKPV